MWIDDVKFFPFGSYKSTFCILCVIIGYGHPQHWVSTASQMQTAGVKHQSDIVPGPMESNGAKLVEAKSLLPPPYISCLGAVLLHVPTSLLTFLHGTREIDVLAISRRFFILIVCALSERVLQYAIAVLRTIVVNVCCQVTALPYSCTHPCRSHSTVKCHCQSSSQLQLSPLYQNHATF